MNIISIDKSVIDQAITNMQSAINKKNVVDITANISLETIKDKLILKATDHEIYITTTLKTNSLQGEIKCAVNGEVIGNIIKGLNDSEVIIEASDENLIIKQNNPSIFKIPIFEINELPFSQDYTDVLQGFQKIDMNAHTLLQSFKKVMHCCNDKEIFNIAMQGILFEIKDKEINIVATDSKRLSYVQKKTEYDKDFTSIIPKKTIQEITKLFPANCEIYIKMMQESNKIETICFVDENVQFYAKLINANFPDFRSIIANKPQTPTMVISKEKMLKTLNQMSTVCQRSKIIFETDKIIFETLEGINGASASITINGIENQNANSITIGLVNKHLLECISNIKQEEFELIINDPYKPILIITQDFEEIIMPQVI